jgi:hypothetical protein
MFENHLSIYYAITGNVIEYNWLYFYFVYEQPSTWWNEWFYPTYRYGSVLKFILKSSEMKSRVWSRSQRKTIPWPLVQWIRDPIWGQLMLRWNDTKVASSLLKTPPLLVLANRADGSPERSLLPSARCLENLCGTSSFHTFIIFHLRICWSFQPLNPDGFVTSTISLLCRGLKDTNNLFNLPGLVVTYVLST